MRVVVLGSGTALADARRGPCGLAVEAAGRWWLIDGGGGTLQRLARAGIDPYLLAGGLYSHRHPDHTGELVPLLFALRIHGRTTPYPIVAGTGFRPFFDALTAAYGRWIQPAGGVPLTELPLDGPATLQLADGVTLTTAPARHAAGALHLRLDAEGHSFVFSGDTGPSPALADLANGVDLLVCECGAHDAGEHRTHLTPNDVADLLRAARPRETWLTHLYPHGPSPQAVTRRLRRQVPDLSLRCARDGDVWSTASVR